ncbi:hypothetical protein MON38_16230 [Hymenobacter sp. DH14]|uniref:Uncharacterized protein n=1 Tax=Hymenobacter cyanobacteriorum TaxID=2926463 RepID=A0A9X1VHI6_9BACT|nr:hypothetical protein [Hymenobacter cyanobacteriorum]MCI1188971.1 hypothetical protein [Hymenobacter cyanobacteriorum]
MNSLSVILLLAAISSSINRPSEKVIAPDETNQAGIPLAKHNPVWVDRHNGRRYALPTSIGEKPVSFYLKNPAVSPLAKALYTSRFRPTDNDSTTQLLALATTKNQEIRPFYRWCLDFTIAISDGALGEYPGEPALAYATTYPQEFFSYMDKDKSGKRYERWRAIIAYSGPGSYNEANSAAKKKIIDRMAKNCPSCSDKIKHRISSFASDVTRTQAGHR